MFELILQKIQVGAINALSMLFLNADDLQPYMSGNACFGLDNKQVKVNKLFKPLIVIYTYYNYCMHVYYQILDFKNSIIMIIREQSHFDEDLVANTFKMLASAAYYQVCFFCIMKIISGSLTVLTVQVCSLPFL